MGKRRSRLIGQAVAVATVDKIALLRRGGLGRVKYAPSTPNIIRAPEKDFVLQKIFWEKGEAGS